MVVEMKKTQREAELVAARRAIEKVALKEHKAVEEVRADMIEHAVEYKTNTLLVSLADHIGKIAFAA